MGSNLRQEIKLATAQTWCFSSEGLLCYPLAKQLCPPLRGLGVTPNGLTIFNIFVGIANSYVLCHRWWMFTAALVFCHQLLDAMDGTMARMFSMQSELGAKLDEFTDIFYGVHLTLATFSVVWPDPIMSLVMFAYAFTCLAGDLAMSSGGKQKKYVDELAPMELWGLWCSENQTYNVWGLLVLIAGVLHLRARGILPKAIDLGELELGGPEVFWAITGVGVVLVISMLYHHLQKVSKKK